MAGRRRGNWSHILSGPGPAGLQALSAGRPNLLSSFLSGRTMRAAARAAWQAGTCYHLASQICGGGGNPAGALGRPSAGVLHLAPSAQSPMIAWKAIPGLAEATRARKPLPPNGLEKPMRPSPTRGNARRRMLLPLRERAVWRPPAAETLRAARKGGPRGQLPTGLLNGQNPFGRASSIRRRLLPRSSHCLFKALKAPKGLSRP